MRKALVVLPIAIAGVLQRTGIDRRLRSWDAEPLASASVAQVHAAVLEDGTDVVITSRSPSQVLAALAASDRLDGVSLRAATLEDVFLELTGREYRE